MDRFFCRISVTRFAWPLLLVLLFANTEAAAQNFWRQTNGPYGGVIYALAINNSNGHIFAGTGGPV
jgi:hypothetical protein